MTNTEGFITYEAEKLSVPNEPTIPFIEGDGIGPDIWRETRKVLDGEFQGHMGTSEKFNGRRCWPEKKLITKPKTGFLEKH